MIEISNKAKEYLLNQLEKNIAIGFIIEIISGGCSGMLYKFSFADDSYDYAQDEIIHFDEFKIFIKPSAVLFVIGTTLDYETTPTGAKLVFKNPNEKDICGCGKSFSF